MKISLLSQLLRWFLFLWTFVGFSNNNHEYYYSITEMRYNEEKHDLQISIKLAAHDLEYIFGKNKWCGNTPLNFEYNDPLLEVCLTNYIQSTFKVTIKEKQKPLVFVGKEYENDGYVYVYFEIVDLPKKMSQIDLENTIFLETYDHQENITHFETIDKANNKGKESFYFSTNVTNHTFNIKL